MMFATFFKELRDAKIPVTLKEYLTLLEAVAADAAGRRVEDFYYLSRAALVKDERHLDRFDQVFGHVFKGLDLMSEAATAEIPEEWLRAVSALYLTDEEKAQIEALGGWDKIMETLAQASRRANGAPPGRQQMDRHRRYVAVRRLRLQSRRRAHRPARKPAPSRDQGLG